MAQIPQKESTIDRIYRAYEERESRSPRAHLGASGIGRPCEREQWMAFRWAVYPKYEGRILRLFDRGQREEPVLIRDLRNAGLEVHAVDPSTGKQFSFSDYGGHFAGSMDGAALGFVEAPKTWHVLEFKTHNDSSFSSLKKQGVDKAHPEHFCQMQMYMGWSGMDRAFYLAVNKDNDDLYGERIQFDRDVFDRLREKAHRIVFAKEPLPRLSESPAFYQCKLCMFHRVCHGMAFPKANCRTCAYSTPIEDGSWTCDRKTKTLDIEAQRQGCTEHLFIPPLMPWPVHNVVGDCPCYETPDGLLSNVPEGAPCPEGTIGFSSRELAILDPSQLSAVMKAKQTFGGVVRETP